LNQVAARPCIAFDMTLVRGNLGGSGTYARELLKELQRRNDVTLDVVEASGGTAGWLLSGEAARLRALRPNAVHGPGFLAPLRSPVPVVLTIHDLSLSRMAGGQPLEWRLYYTAVLPRLARRAAAVLVPTEATKGDVVDSYGVPAERITITPYGVDERFFNSAPSEKPVEVPTILFTGPPIGRKNLDIVLRVLAAAAPSTALASARLLITGASAAEFPTYSQFIEQHGLQGRISWLGRIRNEDMPGLYRRVDMLAYPSFMEGFGFPPLEAMAAGTPVVASNASCLPEVLGDSAILVDPNDDGAFAAAVESVLTDPAVRRRVVEAGTERARGYTWARCAEITAGVYLRVAGG